MSGSTPWGVRDPNNNSPRIAPKAKHLTELGMSQAEIGRRLGVDRWTVGKAVRWLRRAATPEDSAKPPVI